MPTTPAPSLAASAYLGTSAISMVGDLPGLSKCRSGDIGSYQYRTFFSAGVDELDDGAGGVGPVERCRKNHVAAMPIARPKRLARINRIAFMADAPAKRRNGERPRLVRVCSATRCRRCAAR